MTGLFVFSGAETPQPCAPNTQNLVSAALLGFNVETPACLSSLPRGEVPLARRGEQGGKAAVIFAPLFNPPCEEGAY
jgi:hypothetical protein